MSLPRNPTTAAAILLIVLAIVLTSSNSVQAARRQDFSNKYRKPLTFECPTGQVLSSVFSVYSNKRQDRKWRLGCSPVPHGANPTDCQWTQDFVNSFHNPLNFVCPANYALAGVESEFDRSAKDRRMKFKCCQDPAFTAQSCGLTMYLNSWDAKLRYTASRGQVIVGWFSIHGDHRQDRLHKMMQCFYVPKNVAS